jgi:hypothetical protein
MWGRRRLYKKFRSETAPKRGKFHNESNRLSGNSDPEDRGLARSSVMATCLIYLTV